MSDQALTRRPCDPRAVKLTLASLRAQPAPAAPAATLALKDRPSVPANPEVVAQLIAGLDALFAGAWPGRLRDLLDPDDPRPLAIGISDAIVVAAGLDGDGRRRLGRLLRRWTGRARYLRALRTGGAVRQAQDLPADAEERPQAGRAGADRSQEGARVMSTKNRARGRASRRAAVHGTALLCRQYGQKGRGRARHEGAQVIPTRDKAEIMRRLQILAELRGGNAVKAAERALRKYGVCSLGG